MKISEGSRAGAVGSGEEAPAGLPVAAALSPEWTARIAGALYMAVVVLSILALAGIQGMIQPGDPAATAAAVLRDANQVRVAVVANLVATLCYVAVVGLLNELLRPVQPGVSRMAVLFGLAGCVVGAFTGAVQLAAPALLGAEAAGPEMAPVAHGLLVLAARANSVGLTLFGCYCLLLGWLVLRSGFVPKLLGILLMLSGASWLVGNMALLAEPGLAGIFLPLVGLAAIGEILFTLWLLIKGIDRRRWAVLAAERRRLELAPD